MKWFNFRNVKKIDKAKDEANENLVRFAHLKEADLFSEFNADVKGLSYDQYEENLDQYGENIINIKNEFGLIKNIINAFFNPFSVVLIILAFVSLFTDYILVTSGKDMTPFIIIMSLILISGTIRLIQDSRSSKASQSLKDMIKTTATVCREGKISEVPIEELVPGDIINLSAGDMIPGDVRILSSKDLFIRQSSMTGEFEPVEKFPHITNDSNNPLDLSNLAFMGTNVISGSSTAIILLTGDSTLLGSMAKTLTEERGQTTFDKGVRSVSFLLIRFMLIMVPIVFFVNGFKRDDWLQSLLFALSVAVGLTPEMLPMIVTSNLAKGAIFMSKRKVIVKNLNAIQNFGAMDVLCTDKTGTLTEDRIILERHLNVFGEEDVRVLRHGYLNSYFQTGLKNLLDLAIIEFSIKEKLDHLNTQYEKIDEIPFDFSRRRMSVLLKDQNGKTQLITKGAVEEILQICKYADFKGEIKILNEEVRKEIFATVENLNNEGMRVIAIAQKTNPNKEGAFTVEDESDMVLLGYIGFLDPAKVSSVNAIMALRNFGVDIKVLTGDNDLVTKCVANKVGIKIKGTIIGSQIEDVSDEELQVIVEENNIFAKLSPMQKARVVKALQNNNHIVGFMGDGINDAPALRGADIGISVDTAVDIAKEAADIILLEKDLMVLERGLIEGRKIFGNILKYIKMTASSNFGNVLSILLASIFLPFLPMLPIQLLTLNLIYDFTCVTLPWDHVDGNFLKKPRRWEAKSINKFMLMIGPVSSLFDVTTFLFLFFVVCPLAVNGSWQSIAADPGKVALFITLFHTGWFIESLITQTLVIHMLRTEKIPFIQSRAATPILVASLLSIVISIALPFTFLSEVLDFTAPPPIFYLILLGTMVLYIAFVTFMKAIYIKINKELL